MERALNISTRRGKATGFSLLELLIVVIILAILAAIVFPTIFNSSEDARVSAAQTIVRQVSQRIEMAYYKQGGWPDNIQQQWFSTLPKNPFEPEHSSTILDDVDGANNPNKWHPADKSTANFPFWYNSNNGAFRIRVPVQSTNAETLSLYNQLNQTKAQTLGDTSL